MRDNCHTFAGWVGDKKKGRQCCFLYGFFELVIPEKSKLVKRITDEARSEVKSHRWDDGMDDAGNGSGGAQGSADVWIAPILDAIGDSEVYNRESHTVTLNVTRHQILSSTT